MRPRPDAVAAPAGASPRLAELLGEPGQAGYAEALAAREFSFPADHGSHPAFRNEWWYITGNLDSEGGDRYGFELTIFRFALSPPADRETGASNWRSNEVFIGHFAVTDVGRQRFHAAQRYARGGMGLAGARADPFRVWLEDWAIEASGNGWRLYAKDAEFTLDLNLQASRRPVANGIDGLSQKSATAGNASYYYSITRLETQGTIAIGDVAAQVAGRSWLDREWGSSALSPDQEGWDWFALQLSDGSDLMFYELRRHDGSRDPHSAGTLTRPDGTSVYLASDEVLIEVLDTWQSPHGGRYPSEWQIRLPGHELDLNIRPVLASQELRTIVRYWEGAVDVAGERGGQPLGGRGYVELTGYADADRPPRRD